MAYERRSYSGVAVATTLSTSIISTDTSISVAAVSGWPTGGNGPFFLVVDRGTASEEVIKIASRSSTTLTVASSGRGADGTSPTSHSSGAAIELCFTATDADEANAHYANAQSDPHPTYLKQTDAASTYESTSHAASTYLTQANATSTYLTQTNAGTTYAARATFPVLFYLVCSDESTAITTGTAKLTFRAPFAFTLTAVRASVSTASTGGTLVTIDINENGTSVLSTKLTIDNNEKTSTTAATAPVISDSSIADDSEITIDFDQAGSGAKGVKVELFGTRVI